MSEKIRFKYPLFHGDVYTPEMVTAMVGRTTKVDGHPATITDVRLVRDLDGDSIEIEVDVTELWGLTEKGRRVLDRPVVSWEPPKAETGYDAPSRMAEMKHKGEDS